MSDYPTYASVAAGGVDSISSDDEPHRKQKEGYDLVGRVIDQFPPEKPYSVAIEEQPVTFQRLPYIPHEGDPLIDPGTARATIAASNESPNGSTEGWAKRHQDKTVLQQHAVYWDFDGDGIIWPQDTYIGCRKFGWSIPLSFIAAAIINVNLSYPTNPSWIPDPFFRIWLGRIYKDKHGSDSMSYDTEGRFRPQNFEDIFAKYDRGNKGGLDFGDILCLWKGQRMVFDFFGWSATFLEWLATYLLLWPEDGIMRKEDVRRVFDGSIFQYKADEYQRKQQMRKQQRQQKMQQGKQQAKQNGWSIKAKLF